MEGKERKRKERWVRKGMGYKVLFKSDSTKWIAFQSIKWGFFCVSVCWTVGYADETCPRNRVARTSTGRTLLAWFVNLWRPTLIPRNNQVLFNIMLNVVMLRCGNGIILLMGSLRRKLLLVIRPGKMMTLWDLAQNYQLMGFTGFKSLS